MGTKAMKRSGFNLDIYATSTEKKERLGTVRYDIYGRAFRYCLAGGALSRGKLVMATAVSSNHEDKGLAAAYAIGTKSVVTGTLGAAITADAYVDGWLIIQDDTGEGQYYPIVGNTAGTAATLKLGEGLRVATGASATITLQHSPWYGCDHSTTTTLQPVGVPLVDIASGSYGWLQTKGICPVLQIGAIAAGAAVTADSTGSIEGAVGAMSYAVSASACAASQAIVGHKVGMAGNDTEYCPVDLIID